ncbi:Oidioi.mRNA.OKI2018_I69.chr2.g7648.t1.cds [Oikopleura dioica]|uniref:Oidioi.mRNA.OKI2018_I69.chr2.g7648.t1.cds n=1 Tax=Oikopleura dioica TaxID=34765 RepID=A0ABN7TCR7_OIKDI|nr:Oidioi.mRNA.OKI2018_I69.chr2.g7648.t1.cds [Oikopleura dioica]
MSNIVKAVLLLKLVAATTPDLLVKKLSEIIECAHQSPVSLPSQQDKFVVPPHCFSSESISPLSLARSARNTKQIFYHRQDFCENTKCSLHDLYLSIEHMESYTKARLVGKENHPSVLEIRGKWYLNLGMCGGFCPGSLIRGKNHLYDSIHETSISKNVGCAATSTSSIRLITQNHQIVEIEDVITHGCSCVKFHSC